MPRRFTLDDLSKPGAEKIREVFEANDRAMRASFTGETCLEVVNGKTVALTVRLESEYPK